MRALLLLLQTAAVLGVLAVQAICALWAGPDAEAALAPIIARQTVGEVTRLDGGRVACWTHGFDRRRAAEPVDAGWTVRGAGRVYPFQRAWRVERDDPVAAEMVSRPVGPGHRVRRCAEIPERLVGVPVTVTGFVEYRTPWTGRFWTVRQPTPEVAVP